MTWEKVRLEHVCHRITDGTHYTPPNVGDGIAFLTVKDLENGSLNFANCSRITIEEYQKAQAGGCSPKSGDVLFSKDGTVGKVYVVSDTEERFAVLSSLAILTPDQAKIDSAYLGHVLRNPEVLSKAEQNKTGSAIRRIILKDIRGLQIPLPPLPVQRRIAAVLDEVDALRQKRERSIELIDRAISAALPDNIIESKPYKLRDVSLKITDGTHQSPEWADVGIPFIFISSVTKWDINFNSGKYVTEREYEKFIQRIPLESGDIIYTTVGATYGTACLIDELRPMCFQRHIAYIKPNQQIVKPEYLVGVLQSPEYYRWATSRVRGAAQPTLNLSDLKESTIFIPSMEIQEKYIEKRTELVRLRSEALNQLHKLNSLHSSLQARAFAGELALREFD